MSEVVLDGGNGRSLALSRPSAADAESIWRYNVTLSFSEGTVTTEVVDDRADELGRFFRTLADAWRGFEGTREFASLEGQLELVCSHDGLGTVRCQATLCQPWPPEWTVSVVLDFGAGAHLDRLAGEVEAFVGSIL